MRITVAIPDEIAAQAEALGLTPEEYVEKLVAEQASVSSPVKTKEERLADLEKFFTEMSRNSEKIPHLPDEAFTRESFYKF